MKYEKKVDIIIIIAFIVYTCILFFTGYGVCNRFGKGKSGEDIGSESVVTDIRSLQSELIRTKLENEQLTAERDRLVNELDISNGKLESIANELRRCGEDITNQSVEYSERIKAANGNALEYNRIFTERVFSLCDRMEESINRVAEECGVNFSEVK